MLIQLIKFALVGGLATAIHGGLFITLVHIKVAPLLSNTYAFTIAFLFSFLTQSRWTFNVGHRKTRHLVKFALTAAAGFALNSLIVFLSMEYYKQSEYATLAGMILITPISTFLLNKFWVYK